ncbi:DISARM system phospholipase D-like protein DrmC [Paeniglutamicibacter sp. Y32M11]|uniref:DISARM system phospholipase D-like protein DrmC n=1 Tax=Paeniglutamicibacter sp. Y32M11 TaxID=2853258 RepID=UPI001C52C9A3|nr:DISARM system phospholipase D-like protein DrmC [Paeniglutamicibacter sp. Y32M11]QXQ11304.1 DISARM system phospholipase D-like protein DrmC [Paeniglutamicibacter sp. Y32M11]
MARTDAFRKLGVLLTGTEAGLVAEALEDGESLTSAVGAIDVAKRPDVSRILGAAGLRFEGSLVAAVLRGIEGARSTTRAVDTLWTSPGHVFGSGALTTSLVSMVDNARRSVVCSTFNFQKTSGMWTALHHAAKRPAVLARIYIDAEANAGERGPSADEVATWLSPGVVLRTKKFGGKSVRNHAKFVSIDHRFLVITSANFSWSAEYGNIELGVVIDDEHLAERIENELRAAEPHLYERLNGA